MKYKGYERSWKQAHLKAKIQQIKTRKLLIYLNYVNPRQIKKVFNRESTLNRL